MAEDDDAAAAECACEDAAAWPSDAAAKEAVTEVSAGVAAAAVPSTSDGGADALILLPVVGDDCGSVAMVRACAESCAVWRCDDRYCSIAVVQIGCTSGATQGEYRAPWWLLVCEQQSLAASDATSAPAQPPDLIAHRQLHQPCNVHRTTSTVAPLPAAVPTPSSPRSAIKFTRRIHPRTIQPQPQPKRHLMMTLATMPATTMVYIQVEQVMSPPLLTLSPCLPALRLVLLSPSSCIVCLDGTAS